MAILQWLRSVQCYVLIFSSNIPYVVLIFYTLKNTLLQKFFRFFVIFFLQFNIPVSELNCKAAFIHVCRTVSHRQFHTDSYQVSWRQINARVMTKTVYFSKNINKSLPNHTTSLPNTQPFSHSSSGRHNKFLNLKNSNFFTKENFQTTSLHFETSCGLRERCQWVPNVEPEDGGNIFLETIFVMFKPTRLRRYDVWVIFTETLRC